MATNIQVILARDVAHLGRIGDVVKVKPGFARNYLFPRQLALFVTPKKVSHLEHQKRMVEKGKALLRNESEKLRDKLALVQLIITKQAGESGKLFGSVSTRDVAEALAQEGYAMHHRDIQIKTPIKQLGLHVAEIRLEGDVAAQVKIVVAAEQQEEAKAGEEDAQAEMASNEDQRSHETDNEESEDNA